VKSAQVFVERVLPLLILGTAAVSTPIMIAADSGLPRLEKLRKERAMVQDKVSRLSDDIRRLRAEVELIKRDPTHVERVARDELGLVRKTEIVFQFEP
jgi:cell division protein FtsB